MQRDVKIGLVIGLALFIVIVIYFASKGEDSTPGPEANQPTDTLAAPGEKIGMPGIRTSLPAKSLIVDPAAPLPAPTRPLIDPRTTTPALVGPAAPSPRTGPMVTRTPTTLPVVRGPSGTPLIGGRSTPPSRITPRTPLAPSTSSIYVVQSDDITGFSGIAEKKYGHSKYYYLIEKANQGIDSRRLRPGQKINIPPMPRQTPAGSVGRVTAVSDRNVYIVQADDKKGFWAIAEKRYGHGKYWYLISKANPGVRSEKLRAGQKIIVPPMPSGLGSTASSTAGRSPGTASPTVAMLAATKTQTYIVRPGDMLSTIAQAKYGSARYHEAIAEANPGIDPNNLKVGSKLILPALTDKLRGASLPRAPRPAATSSGDEGRPVFD